MSLVSSLTKTEKRIIGSIYRLGPLSKHQIAETNSLGWGTVVKFVALLEEKGILTECGTVTRDSGKGKNAYIYGFTDSYPLSVGIDVEYRTTNLVVTNLSHDVILESRTETGDISSIRGTIDFIKQVLDAFLEGFDAGPSIIGIGIGLPGIGVPAFSLQDHPENRQIIIDEIEQRFGIPAAVEINTKAYTVYEHLIKKGFVGNHFLLVSIRTGVGSGIVLDGKLFTGPGGLAGEIGHFTVEPDGALCRCGKKGCLETVVNEGALMGDFESIGDAFRRADEGNPAARHILATAADYLGDAIARTLIILNLSKVIVSGRFDGHHGFFTERLQEAVRQGVMPGQRIDLEVGDFDPQGHTQGAALLIFRELME